MSTITTLPCEIVNAVLRNEQIGCVQDFLELQLAKASRDVIAHNVFFGELRIDYLTPGYMNDARQKLLGQGICSVHKLMTETMYDAKLALLESAFASRGTALHETLLGLYADDQHANGTPLKDYSKEEREALSKSSAHQKDDTGRGPFAAWWAANEELPLYSTLMMSNNAGFRDGACVFWDDDRLKRYNLLAYFAGNAPESELALLDTEEEQNAMEASFDARSAIWQNNGRGYWSRHGESRII